MCADIVIEIPGNLGQDDSSYRLDYYPPFGNPLPNTTIASKDVGDEIQFSNVLAGTKYNFWLYYTNSSHHNLLAWTVSITTGKFSIFFNMNLANIYGLYQKSWGVTDALCSATEQRKKFDFLFSYFMRHMKNDILHTISPLCSTTRRKFLCFFITFFVW